MVNISLEGLTMMVNMAGQSAETRHQGELGQEVMKRMVVIVCVLLTRILLKVTDASVRKSFYQIS